MKKLKLRYEWSGILTLSEEHEVDFFFLLENPMVYGIKGLLSTLTVGAQAEDPSITREQVYEYLKKQKGSIGDELKKVFEEIAKSIPKDEDESSED